MHKAMHKVNEIYLFTNLLEVLLDGGAHQHFVYQHGKTAMDLAKTDEARSILWDKRKLKLKCISARAVKRFGLPYLGVVPKILEKFISMHLMHTYKLFQYFGHHSILRRTKIQLENEG